MQAKIHASESRILLIFILSYHKQLVTFNIGIRHGEINCQAYNTDRYREKACLTARQAYLVGKAYRPLLYQ